MSDPTRMTAAALADALASGDLSSEQITRAHLDLHTLKNVYVAEYTGDTRRTDQHDPPP